MIASQERATSNLMKQASILIPANGQAGDLASAPSLRKNPPGMKHGAFPTTIRSDIRQQQGVAKCDSADWELETLRRSGNGSAPFEVRVSGKSDFFYERVKQEGGDRARPVPVWINYPRIAAASAPADEWVWTASPNSRVCHHDWCRVANAMAPQNRRSGGDSTGLSQPACLPVAGNP